MTTMARTEFEQRTVGLFGPLSKPRSRGPPHSRKRKLPAEDWGHGGHKLSHSIQSEDFFP